MTRAYRHDPNNRGLRDDWETIIATGRRGQEVRKLRLDGIGRYRGLAMLWHDQTVLSGLLTILAGQRCRIRVDGQCGFQLVVEAFIVSGVEAGGW